MGRFADKVVLVAGATSGIGRAAAKAFANEGAKLIVTGRNKAAARQLVDELTSIGAQAVFAEGDVSNEATVKDWVGLATMRFGKLDIAVNNAGVEGQLGPVTTQSEQNYRDVFDVNVKGTMLALKHEIPALAASGGGAIVNVSSMVGAIGMAGASVYVASKHAVNGLTRSAALETASQGIRVNAVAPGVVATEMLQRFTGRDAKVQSGLASAHPVGRIAQPEEIAQAILYLASDDAKFITGSVLTIDGGYTVQ